jgi:hypothetical protein
MDNKCTHESNASSVCVYIKIRFAGCDSAQSMDNTCTHESNVRFVRVCVCRYVLLVVNQGTLQSMDNTCACEVCVCMCMYCVLFSVQGGM